MNRLDSSFNLNELSMANNYILKLYNSLFVIGKSLELVIDEGLHEFEPVIIQQLRLILLKYNDTHNPKKGCNRKFALIELLNERNFFDVRDGQYHGFYESRLFPLISVQERSYEERMQRSSYFYISENSFEKYDELTYGQFLSHNIFDISTSVEEKEFINVEKSIRILANKAQGAHYQINTNMKETKVILNSSKISQLLGLATYRALFHLVEDLIIKFGLGDYLDRSKHYNFDVYSFSRV